jgi:ketosteroid isomerase-like protein
MGDRAELEKLTGSLFAARDANDAKATVMYFHPDCVFQIMGSEKLGPMTHKISGRPSLDNLMEGLAAQWDFSKVQNDKIYIDGDTVIVRRKGTVRYVPADKFITTEWVDIFTVRDGLIVEFAEFIDTFLVAETVGPV